MLLVTGGAGFIGSNLVAALAERGHAVVVCDWLRSDERWRNLAKHELADLVAPEDLRAWLGRHGAHVEAIFHMGAVSATTETDVDLIVARNVRATLDLWEWCTVQGVRFVYASSAATYGDGSAGFDDALGCRDLSRLRPLNAYGWSKLLIDRRIARLVAEGEPQPPQWAGLRFFNVYGPNEYHKGSMQSVVAKNYGLVRAAQPLALFRSYRADYADGGQLRDFVYVQDCVEVMLWLLENPAVSGFYNLGTGHARTWLDLGRALFDAVAMAPSIEFIDMPDGLIAKYQYFTEARMERLRAAGFERPFTTLEDGISRYVRDYLGTDDPYR